MAGIYRLIKSTIIGGLFVLLPVAVLAAIVVWAVGSAVSAVKPLLKWMPDASFGGVSLTVVVTMLGILACCFAAGIVAETALVRRLGGRAERFALFVPGYSLLKSVGANMVGAEGAKALRTVMVRFDDAWQLGFLMATLPDGRHAVFLPNAPNALTGRLRFVAPDRVQMLTMTVSTAFDVFSCMGVGCEAVWAKEPPAT